MIQGGKLLPCKRSANPKRFASAPTGAFRIGWAFRSEQCILADEIVWLNVWLKQTARPFRRAKFLICLVEPNGIEPSTS